MKKIVYGKRQHRSTLKESLETSIIIDEFEFKKLLKNKKFNYEFYCYDDRCYQILFLDTKAEYDWLFIQLPFDQDRKCFNYEKRED